MQNLMLFVDFQTIEEKEVKCSHCKRMYCLLKQVLDEVLCKDCFQKQIETNPSFFEKQKFSTSNQAAPLPNQNENNEMPSQLQKQEIMTQKNIKKSNEVEISPFLLIGYIFLGIIATSGVILAIVLGLYYSGLIVL